MCVHMLALSSQRLKSSSSQLIPFSSGLSHSNKFQKMLALRQTVQFPSNCTFFWILAHFATQRGGEEAAMLGLKNSSARLIPCVQNEHMLLCLSPHRRPSYYYVLEMAFTNNSNKRKGWVSKRNRISEPCSLLTRVTCLIVLGICNQ